MYIYIHTSRLTRGANVLAHMSCTRIEKKTNTTLGMTAKTEQTKGLTRGYTYIYIYIYTHTHTHTHTHIYIYIYIYIYI